MLEVNIISNPTADDYVSYLLACDSYITLNQSPIDGAYASLRLSSAGAVKPSVSDSLSTGDELNNGK